MEARSLLRITIIQKLSAIIPMVLQLSQLAGGAGVEGSALELHLARPAQKMFLLQSGAMAAVAVMQIQLLSQITEILLLDQNKP
jgi:hypothetical protein